MKYEKLLSEGKIGSLTLKNRVVLEPMLLGVGELDGTAGDKMIAYYEERAKGGVGLLITEVTRISERHGATSPIQLAMTSDRHIEPLRKMTNAVHSHGAKLFVQLHHPGRQNLAMVVTAWQLSENIGRRVNAWWDVFFSMTKYLDFFDSPLMRNFYFKVPSASAIKSCLGATPVVDQPTRALKKSEIKTLVRQFAQAARRVKEAGADGVQLHAAHGYLIQQFLSPYTNKRTDEYGGPLENRMRFLKEIIAAVRAECGPDFPVIVRLTVDEFYRKIGYNIGLELDEGVKIAKALEQAGIDAIDVSSGTYETISYWLEPTSFELGWRKHLAKAVKEAVGVPVIAANLIRTPEQAESQLQEGIQDFIGLGRPLLADPYWVRKAEEDRAEDIQRCVCCLWCIESMYKNVMQGKPGECALNPRTCKETEFPLEPKKDGEGRTVVVVGAGPAGLMAAKVLGQRNFKPIVLEKNEEPGGQLRLASVPPHKEKIKWAIADLEHAAKQNGAEIRYNTPATVEAVTALNPYAVIDATGGESVRPKIKGSDGENVCTVNQILDGTVKLSGKKVAVIGSGMTGLETAELIATQGNEIIIVEMAGEIAPGTWKQHVYDVKPRLDEMGAKFFIGRKLVEITADSIVLESVETGAAETVAADFVVLAVGVRSNNIADIIRPHVGKVYSVGDASKVGRIANATHTAYRTALTV